MTTLPVEDSEFYIIPYADVRDLILENQGQLHNSSTNRQSVCDLSASKPSYFTGLPTGDRSDISRYSTQRHTTASDLLFPLKFSADADEWTKKNTDNDILGWKDTAVRAGTLFQQVRILGISGQAYLKEVGGKSYVILKGFPGLREKLRGTRYLRDHQEIRKLSMVIGAGEYVEEGIKAVKVSIFIAVPIDIAKELLEDKPSWYHLGCGLVSDVGGAIILEAVAGTVGVMLSAAAFPVVAVGVLSLAAGTAALMTYNHLVEKYQLTEKLEDFLRTHMSDYRKLCAAYASTLTHEISSGIQTVIQTEEAGLKLIYYFGRSALVGKA